MDTLLLPVVGVVDVLIHMFAFLLVKLDGMDSGGL